MSATHAVHCTPTAAPVLYVAFELGWASLEDGLHRRRGPATQDPLGSGSLSASVVLNEIKKAKLRFRISRGRPGGVVLRSRPRWLLDSPLPRP